MHAGVDTPTVAAIENRMARIGRNDPCPCRSGRKYKQCCAAAHEADDRALRAVRRAEGQAVEAVVEWACRRYGTDLLDMAWTDFVDAKELESPDEDLPEFESTFFPWLICNWVPRDWQLADDTEASLIGPELPRGPLATAYLEDVEPEPAVARFLRAACAEPFSFFAIESAVPGRSLTLRDLLNGREVTVAERLGSANAPTGILYSRVLTMDGVSIQFGCAPILIPSREELALIDLRDELTAGRLFTREELRAHDDDIRMVYWSIVDALRDPSPPQLRNGDGDPLRFVKLEYTLACSPGEAMAAFDDQVDYDVEHVEREPDGEIVEARLVWAHTDAEAESTTFATLTITPGRLMVQVDSERRAEAARAEIAARLGLLATFDRATSEDPIAALAARRDSADLRRHEAESARLNALPEVQAHLRELVEAHYEAWVDDPLPALGGQTPREAVRTPLGRERVEVLLAQLEDRAGLGAPLPDMTALRRRLGL